MTARAGIHVLHVSRVYGRTIGHRATNCNSPFIQHHSTPDLPPRLPRRSRKSHVVPRQLRGHPRDARPKRFKCFKKPKKKMASESIQDNTSKQSIKKKLPSYLMPALVAAFKVVVALKLNSAVSFAPSRGPHGSWHSKVLFLTIQRSNLTWTCFPSGSTIMHHDAWPMPPTSLRISTSSTTRGR